jgi:hypothetical protein
MWSHIHSPVPDVRARRPELAQPLADLLARALAKDPVARQQSAADFADAARRALS